MSDTPRTDEVYDNNRGAGLAKAMRKHANELERENAALRRMVDTIFAERAAALIDGDVKFK